MPIETYGFDEFDAILTQMGEEFGYTDVNKKVLIPALRDAMKVTLPTAQSLARVNTGRMKESLKIEARRPSDRDKQSKYIYANDAAFAMLSVKRSAVSLGEEFGTANKTGRPFIRPALESRQNEVLSVLSEQLKKRIEKYKARQSKDRS